MALLSRGLRCTLGAILLMAGPAVHQCPAALLEPEAGEERRDEYTHASIAPLANPSSYSGSGFDVGSAGYWAWAFGDLSARFDLGFIHEVTLSSDSAASFSLPGAGAARFGQPAMGQAGVTDGMFRAARDSLLDENNAANYSFAGLEVDVNLKDGRRSITVNGYDVLPALQTVVQRDDAPTTLVEAKYTEAPPARAPDANPDYPLDTRVILQELRALASDPVTLFIAAALVLGWLFARTWSKVQDVAGRSRSRSHSHSRRR